MTRSILLLPGALWALALPFAALADGDPARGRDVALANCSLCHVVGDANRMGGIGSTPSFALMSKKFDNYAPRIQSFKERRPHRAMEFDGDRIRHMTKVWNDVMSLQQLGWM